MPGNRPIAATPIVPELPLDGVSEVEADRPGNAKYGYGVQLTGPSGLAAGNLTQEENRPPPDSGAMPFGPLTGKR